MTTANHAQATRATHAPSRNRRGGVRPAWVRPYCRAERALAATIRLIGSTRRAVARSERCAHRRPVQTSRNLHEVAGLLVHASSHLRRAAKELDETNECIARDPGHGSAASSMFVRATERCVQVTGWLQDAAADVFGLQEEVLLGLETGLLVPERPAGRPRIILAPRPVPIRAFLLLRQPRVTDRIAPILRRRRRTPRPASVRVPRRCLRGRAPPLFPISLL